MTIVITVVMPEGVVIASDSRETFQIPNLGARVGSDYVVKAFQLTPTIGAVTFGWAFLSKKNINSLAVQFRQTLANTTPPVQDVAQRLGQYFDQEYQRHITAGLNQPPPSGQLALGFHVAGYDPGSLIGEVWRVAIPGPTGPVVQQVTTSNNPGSVWDGQVDAVTRLLKGYDPMILNLPNLPANFSSQLSQLQYAIPFDALTLQDGVDYAIFLIRTTIEMQRFSFGTQVSRSIPGVGGEIDIAVIEPQKELRFLQKKELRGERFT